MGNGNCLEAMQCDRCRELVTGRGLVAGIGSIIYLTPIHGHSSVAKTLTPRCASISLGHREQSGSTAHSPH
eukprot:scaffold2188_cov388-Prasinococcus_capsulatus_cf.AAC.20